MRLKRFVRLAVFLFLVQGARAQVDTGVITGLVTDETGALIPGAVVTIAGEETKLQYTVQSNATGLYVSPGLRTGRYRVTAQKDGFRTEIRTGIEVRVQDRVQINFTLSVGATRVEVSVAALAPLLESETSSLGQVVPGRMLAELPMNGRNFMALATLAPGTLPSTRTVERDNFIANGARAIQNTYLLDGVENKNHIVGFDTSSAQVIQAAPDMIQEFKVQTSGFSAEFGQAAGGVVNVTMKSGSNDLHGSLFHFLRHDKIQATPFFQPVGGGKPLFRRNQFGATLGGPLVRNRTFFFGSWQSSRAQSTAPGFATVPSADQREGRFGARAMYDPGAYNAAANSRQPFLNNTIPAARFDSVARQVMPLYPLPNLSGAANNLFSNQKEKVDPNQGAVRVDHQLGPRDTVFTRVIIQQDHNVLPALMPAPANDPSQVYPRARSAALSETHTFSPAVVNEFRYGFARSFLYQDIEGENLFAKFGIKVPTAGKVRGLPEFSPTGYSTLGTSGPGARPIPATGSGNLPILKVSNVHHLTDNVSVLHGRHSIKFGGDVQFVQYNANVTLSARPVFAFDNRFTNDPLRPANTGLSLGDFLLGLPQNVNISTPAESGARQRIFQLYLQDDWKLSNRLTINAGIRWELAKPFFEVADRQSNFILESDSPAFLTVLKAAESSRGGLGRSLVNPDYNNFAPRIGFAYSASGKTVIRSGFGIFYGRDENIGVNRRLVNNPPFFVRTNFQTGTINPVIKLDQGLPPDAVDPSRVVNPEVNSYPRGYRTPYVIQWNFNVEREVFANTVFQVGYTGSGGRKLYFPLDMNRPLPGPGGINPRRPIQGYVGILNYAPIVRSSYNALIARLERRFSGGFTVLASYTWGHSLDDGRNQNDNGDPGPVDTRNLKLEHASSNYDIRHRFVSSYVWELPFGKGRRWLADNPVASALLGGWGVSGITSLQGGLPYTVQLNRDPSNSTSPGRPDRLRHGALEREQRTLQRFFDISAFVDPAVPTPGVFRFGNSGRSILGGPGAVNFDFGAQRNFHVQEWLRLQFRAEFFNLFNTPQFDLPARTIGNPQAGIINSVANPERQIQFALKLVF